MARNSNPKLRQELQNLEKDPESRKQAMKALKLYVKELDSKTIPQFLAQVSETKDAGSSAGEHTISLYEVLAKNHGTKIVPQIGNIMGSIVKTLSRTAVSVALHQACANVVSAIAMYGIEPHVPDEKKRLVIHSLCKPLSDCLLASQENLSAGAALCLKELVESDNWRFASTEMVNEVCLRVAGSLEGKCTQTHSHMSLVMSLAKQNALIVEAYARLLVHSGLRILQTGVTEGNSQKRLSAIQMVCFLLKSLDPMSVLSEIGIIVERMEHCQSDQIGYVKGAAYECMVTAKGIAARNGSKFEQTGLYNGLNTIRRESSQSYLSNGVTHSVDSLFTYPESQTLGSFGANDSFHETPISTSRSSGNNVYSRRSSNRKLWNQGNRGVDVSLKDGILSGLAKESEKSDAYPDLCDEKMDCTDEFAGFTLGHARNVKDTSADNSPPRTHSRVNVENVKIYSTPRRLIRSLQDVDMNSEIFQKQFRKFLSPCANCDWSPLTGYDQNSTHYSDNENTSDKGYTSAESEDFQNRSESVSSTDDIILSESANKNTQTIPQDVNASNNNDSQQLIGQPSKKGKNRLAYRVLVCFVFLVLTVLPFIYLIDIDYQEEGKVIVPT